MSYENVLHRLFNQNLTPKEFEKQLHIHFGESVSMTTYKDPKHHDIFIPKIEKGKVVGGKFYNTFYD